MGTSLKCLTFIANIPNIECCAHSLPVKQKTNTQTGNRNSMSPLTGVKVMPVVYPREKMQPLPWFQHVLYSSLSGFEHPSFYFSQKSFWWQWGEDIIFTLWMKKLKLRKGSFFSKFRKPGWCNWFYIKVAVRATESDIWNSCSPSSITESASTSEQ